VGEQGPTRREFVVAAALGALGTIGAKAMASTEDGVTDEFAVAPDELTLALARGDGERRLSFGRFAGRYDEWAEKCRAKLAELLGYAKPSPADATVLRSCRVEGVTIEAWVMEVDDTVTIPAYLLTPAEDRWPGRGVMAVHGHGDVRALIGPWDDYHHRFGLELAKAGHLVLCPALRGFGPLWNMAHSDKGRDLDYWGSERGRQFTLVTDAFLFGKTLIGDTVEDLARWEDWLSRERGVQVVDVAGISYGGDLSIVYPAFSTRADRIYCSGSMGSFSGIFARCYNAPAHCIPRVLTWMDRSDIAGLHAPRPIRVHYGELDIPGPDNNSAAYNETSMPALDELRTIYACRGAEDEVSLRLTPGAGHETEIPDLLRYFGT